MKLKEKNFNKSAKTKLEILKNKDRNKKPNL
jgi:hypothetical protein